MNNSHDLSFIDTIEEFRAIPSIIMELMGLLNELPDKEIEITIVNRIGLDPALAAFVLKFCNSPFFAHRKSINTISHAYHMMGFTRIKSILMSYFLRSLCNKIGNEYFSNYLWEHSFQVAFIARELANHLGQRKIAEEAYTAGLLHDIGKQAIYFHDRLNYEYLLQHVDKERKPLLPLEQSTYGFSHADTGTRLLEKWRFSELLIHSVQYHHDFDNYPGKEKVVGIVAFANITAHYALEKQEELPVKFLEFFKLTENRYNKVIEDIFRILSSSWLISLE